MDLQSVTGLILTLNEAPNLDRVLSQLSWAPLIVIVDSGSTDESELIAARYPNVRWLTRAFDNHSAQWNFGLSRVESEWVLALDADYVCPDSLSDELSGLVNPLDIYFCRFRYCVFGHPLRSTLYPARPVLFRPKQCVYYQDGHTQSLETGGRSYAYLDAVFDHDDRKPLSRWVVSQRKYATLEADKLKAPQTRSYTWKDKLRRRIVLAPLLNLIYCLLIKRLILDGWPGIYYSLQRTYAELLLSLELLDQKLRPPDHRNTD